MSLLGKALGGMGGSMGGGLGAATVYVSANLAKLEAGLAKARADTEKATNGMSDLWDRSGKIIGTTALLAFAAFEGYAVKAFMNAQQVGVQTEATIQSMGVASQITAQHVEDLSRSLARMAGVDDEAVQGAANLMLTFRNAVPVFDRAMQVTIDLSRRFGIDLNQAALKVGKALQDPVTGLTSLTRYGIQFTAQQKAMAKAMFESGNVAGAQEIIFKELEAQVGGAAKAYGDTAAGQIGKLTMEFENFAEVAGGNVVYTLQAVAGGFLALAAGAKAVTDKLKEMTGIDLPKWLEYGNRWVMAFVTLGLSELGRAYTNATASSKAATAATADYAQGTADATSAVEDQTTALSDLSNEMFDTYGAIVDAADAQKELTQARKAYNQAVKQFGRNSQEAKDAEQELEDAQRGSLDATLSSRDAIKQFQDEIAQGDRTRKEIIADLIQQARRAGYTAKEARDLGDALRAIPTNVPIHIDTASLQAANTILSQILAKTNQLGPFSFHNPLPPGKKGESSPVGESAVVINLHGDVYDANAFETRVVAVLDQAVRKRSRR